MYKIYKWIIMFLWLLPLVIRWKRSIWDSLKLMLEQEEHMDAGLVIYDWYRRAFHYNRYIFANKYNMNTNDTILDIASWFWYWSKYLAKYSKEIKSVDLSKYAINYAKKYYFDSKVEYINWDATNIKLEKKFNKIISFETIEHLPSDDIVNQYLKNIHTHLKDDWLFFCSSPNKWWLTKYHFQDYNHQEFKEKLESNWFKVIESYMQNSWDIQREENHWQIWWIYKINNKSDEDNAEVLLLIAQKC